MEKAYQAQRPHIEMGYKADEEKVKALIEEMATAYEDPSEVIAYYEQNEQMMNNHISLPLINSATNKTMNQQKFFLSHSLSKTFN